MTFPRWMSRNSPARRRHAPGTMNKTEAAYALHLQNCVTLGLVESFRFEAVKLRLADKTFYTPDFFVVFPDHFEMHEIKGHWEDDAVVKWKVVREQYPWFRFLTVKALPHGGGWETDDGEAKMKEGK